MRLNFLSLRMGERWIGEAETEWGNPLSDHTAYEAGLCILHIINCPLKPASASAKKR